LTANKPNPSVFRSAAIHHRQGGASMYRPETDDCKQYPKISKS